MSQQFSFLEAGDERDTRQHLPPGMRYEPRLISEQQEAALVERVCDLAFKNFEFHGCQGKRRTVSFGWHYEFSGAGKLRRADDIPDFLLPLRARAASFAGVPAESLQHVLVIEYEAGTGIGWHRDKPVFGNVVGVSLLSPCVLRFRRKTDGENNPEIDPRGVLKPKTGRVNTAARRRDNTDSRKVRRHSTWERLRITAEPRSAYLLSGPAREEWQHSILRVDCLRYCITFRSLRED